MKKILFFALLVPLIGAITGLSTWIGGHGFSLSHNRYGSEPEKAVASLQTTQAHVPVKILIPRLSLEAQVESVGMDSSRRMDVPKNADNAAWYNLGYKPGEKGNAVIAGHFDKATGVPAVFYELEKLKKGDHVITVDKEGKTLTFAVTRIAAYPDNNFPLEEVFGGAEKPMLNLITCDGEWNTKTKSYSHRTVVYSEMVK